MEATVVKTKMLANAIAQEVQHECEAISAMPFGNTQELVQSRIKMGLSQNIADRDGQLRPSSPAPSACRAHPVPVSDSSRGNGGAGSRKRRADRAMQMLSQMGSDGRAAPCRSAGCWLRLRSR